MDSLLQDIQVCIYLDDILITGATEAEHLHNLHTGSTELLKASRYVCV